VGTLVLLSLIILTFGGAALLRRGWRGVAIDDHPLCRRCGYDLHGRPAGAAAVCPECGADLSKPRSRRIGHRRKSRGVLTAGLALLVIALGEAGTVGVMVTRNYDWHRIEPVWLLLREAKDTSGQPAALLELIRRLEDGKLSQRQIDTIADTALSLQADANRPWQPIWGDFIDAARSKQRLDDGRWRRYASTSLDFALPPNALTVSQRSLPSNVLHVTVTYRPGRTGAIVSKTLYLQTTVRAVGADGGGGGSGGGGVLADKQYASQVEHPLQWAGGNFAQPYKAALDPKKIATTRSSEQTVRVTVEAIVSEIPDFFLHQEREPGKYQPVVTRTVTYSAPFHLLLAATQPTPSAARR
jgi:hypothetical protein